MQNENLTEALLQQLSLLQLWMRFEKLMQTLMSSSYLTLRFHVFAMQQFAFFIDIHNKNTICIDVNLWSNTMWIHAFGNDVGLNVEFMLKPQIVNLLWTPDKIRIEHISKQECNIICFWIVEAILGLMLEAKDVMFLNTSSKNRFGHRCEVGIEN